MTTMALRRHVRNAPSTPYSWVRSNSDHLLHFESTNYSDMLDKTYLENTPRGKIHIKVKSHPDFRHGPLPYFEFSKHDPTNPKFRNTFQRRIEKMLTYRQNSELKTFVYSHRSPNGYKKTTGNRILNTLNYINNAYTNCRCISITQHLVRTPSERGIKIQKISDKLIFYTILSNQYWSGEQLITSCDDDLLSIVFLSCTKLFGFLPGEVGLL